MPRGRVTQRTWAESHDQRYIVNVPGLLRVWRLQSGGNSRRPRASPHAHRLPLRNAQSNDIQDSHGRQNFDRRECWPTDSPLEDSHAREDFNRDERERKNQPVDRPSAFDSWQRLPGSLPFEEVDDNPRDQSDNTQPRYEARRPARAMDENGASAHADQEPRYRGGRHHREDDRYAASESSHDRNASHPWPRQGAPHRERANRHADENRYEGMPLSTPDPLSGRSCRSPYAESRHVYAERIRHYR